MPAMPDLLLTSAPNVQAKAKVAEPAREPSKDQASSFASVYARERQGPEEPASAAASKTDTSVADAKAGDDSDVLESASDGAIVAADGNTLPQPGTELDPLIAMALLGLQAQPLAEDSELPPATDALEAVGLDLNVFDDALTFAGPEATASAPVQLVELEPESSPVVTAEQAAAVVPLNATAALGSDELPVGDEAELEALAAKLDSEQLDSLKDSAQPLRPELFVSKPSASATLTSAQSAARIPLVPGAPLSMQQGGWSEAVVDKVMWMSSQNLKTAEIQLNPLELGRLEVRVNLTQDQAQVTFSSANAVVRDALETQMHRLREMFAQQGMSLSDANVSDQSLNRGGQERNESLARDADERVFADDERGQSVLRGEVLSAGRGLVDYYA